jgi:ABC-2 type transport system ATP-binding protein
VLDEPTTGLDPLLQETFHDFLREESEQGTTVFLSSHTLPEVRRACDRVGVIRQGELVAVEPVEELLARGGKRVTLHVAEAVDEADFDLPGVRDLRVDDGVHFTFSGEYDQLVDLLDQYTLQDLEIEEAPLEDVFMGFYGDD